jgi:hypothetical protein
MIATRSRRTPPDMVDIVESAIKYFRADPADADWLAMLAHPRAKAAELIEARRRAVDRLKQFVELKEAGDHAGLKDLEDNLGPAVAWLLSQGRDPPR